MSVVGNLRRKVRFFLGRVRSQSASGTAVKDYPIDTDVRLLSTAVSSARAREEAEAETDANELVSEKFMNRNPRNLERMALAVKDRGWATVWPSRHNWHRLVLSRTQHHVTAQVLSGAPSSLSLPVLSASTQEWAIKRHLPSTRGVSACENIGRVLAQRCLEAGIQHVTFRAIPWEFRSQSVQRFCTALKEGGLILSEPRRIYREMHKKKD
ncbi:large ribosomal subunit protein uL18m isoform X2 [Amia ocellicauda]|uniref:large ribosomal subunit protein uL18m isoform X2 n=1 Tax=Amia ocellicauda TaxID=2972642 RepID=UPI003464A250